VINENDGLVVAVEQLTTIRARMDAVHSDAGSGDDADGHGDAGGDGLNITETSRESR
jgi:hypothetical protein